jgi:hypothetical protein
VQDPQNFVLSAACAHTPTQQTPRQPSDTFE